MAGGGSLSLGRDIAIDLGTANTLVFVKGEGVVLNEPSTVAVDNKTGQLVAVGFEAKRMWGRAPQNIRLVRPLKDGVIADFDVCEKMLRFFIQKVHTSRWNKPRMIICVPSEITGVERRAVQDAAVVKPEIDLRGLSTLELRTLALPGRNVTGVCGNWANATLTGGPDSQAHPSR